MEDWNVTNSTWIRSSAKQHWMLRAVIWKDIQGYLFGIVLNDEMKKY